MTKIVVVGSSSIDLVVVSEKRPNAGETVIGQAFHIVPGGKGANQAVAAARLNSEVTIIGAVGKDPYGEMILENFRNESIHIENVKLTDTKTGTAHIVLAEGDNSIVVVPGANGMVDKEQVNFAKGVITDAQIVLIQLEIPIETVQYVLSLCNELGVPVILNPAPAHTLTKEMIQNATFLTPNEHECRIVLNDFTTPLEDLISNYPNKLIVTEGKNGVRFHNGSKIVHVPSINVEVVDSTGAGDTFNGAFAVALAKGETLEDSIYFANVAAGISVTKIGAQGGMPTLDQISKLKASINEIESDS